MIGPDDGAGNLSFGRSLQPPPPGRPFNRRHQLAALIDAAHRLDEDGRLPHEVLEALEPGTSMGGARPKVTVEDEQRVWLARLPEKGDRHNVQRVEYAKLELARAAGLRVCQARLERVGFRDGTSDVLMLARFDREWNSQAKTYARHVPVSELTVLDAEDGTLGRERWSYPLLADELRRGSVKPAENRRELYRRMVFSAMVTNNVDHPRNHALLHTTAGWRLRPAYDILLLALVCVERRDLALQVGRFGRAASLYNLPPQCEAFGLGAGRGAVADRRHVGRCAWMARVIHRARCRCEGHRDAGAGDAAGMFLPPGATRGCVKAQTGPRGHPPGRECLSVRLLASTSNEMPSMPPPSRRRRDQGPRRSPSRSASRHCLE